MSHWHSLFVNPYGSSTGIWKLIVHSLASWLVSVHRRKIDRCGKRSCKHMPRAVRNSCLCVKKTPSGRCCCFSYIWSRMFLKSFGLIIRALFWIHAHGYTLVHGMVFGHVFPCLCQVFKVYMSGRQCCSDCLCHMSKPFFWSSTNIDVD